MTDLRLGTRCRSPVFVLQMTETEPCLNVQYKKEINVQQDPFNPDVGWVRGGVVERRHKRTALKQPFAEERESATLKHQGGFKSLFPRGADKPQCPSHVSQCFLPHILQGTVIVSTPLLYVNSL